MSESKFQTKVMDALKCRGWTVVKNIRTNISGWPDLTAYKVGYPALFIEVKGVKTPVDPLQKYRHKQLRKAGFKVRILRAKT